jgi:hypothetical protein
MPMSCNICKAEASPDLKLQHCAACQSAVYCSRACQREDWSKHKKICKLLNVGHGVMQLRSDLHERGSLALKITLQRGEFIMNDDMKLFFKLFTESTLEGSRAAARKMKKIAKRQNKHNQRFLVFHSVVVLIQCDSEKLSWPNSPLLMALQFVDPNVLSGDDDAPLQEGETRLTPLNQLAEMADPSDYSTHEKQLILAKQLIEHGANANAASIPHGRNPLHNACYMGNVTNLDFIELLLEAGADPNVKDHSGVTPLMWTMGSAPGAAKFLLNWPATDANISTRFGGSVLGRVRKNVEHFAIKAARPPHQLQQWREIEEMLVARGARDTGVG